MVNPTAQTDPNSPISGMLVLEVWKATHTITVDRSLRVGCAGVGKLLYFNDNNSMFLGDAKKSVDKLVNLLRLTQSTEHTKDDNSFGNEGAPQKYQALSVVEDFIGKISRLQEEAFVKVGVVCEVSNGERRVAIVLAVTNCMLCHGMLLVIETGGGYGDGFYDSECESHGSRILSNAKSAFYDADAIIKIKNPGEQPVTGKHDINMVPPVKTLISFLSTHSEVGKALMDRAVNAEIDLLAVDAIPLILMAQSLDVLSSQDKISGYR